MTSILAVIKEREQQRVYGSSRLPPETNKAVNGRAERLYRKRA